MTLIIDGYNLIYASERWSDHMDAGRLEDARQDMAAAIGDAFAGRREPITIVFDGRRGPAAGRREASSIRGLKIVYTQDRGSADEKIIDMVAASREPGTMTVVTSDKRVAAAVREYGARTVASRTFRVQVFERLRMVRRAAEEAGRKPAVHITYNEYMQMLKEHEQK